MRIFHCLVLAPDGAQFLPSFVGFRLPVRSTSRGVANSSPRQTHERRVLNEGASFALCAAFLRGGPGWLGPRCLGVLTAGSPDSPAGRPDGPEVSPGLSARGCRVKSGSGLLERSLTRGSGALGRRRSVDLEHDVPARVVGFAPPLRRLRVPATATAPARIARSRRARCGA